MTRSVFHTKCTCCQLQCICHTLSKSETRCIVLSILRLDICFKQRPAMSCAAGSFFSHVWLVTHTYSYALHVDHGSLPMPVCLPLHTHNLCHFCTREVTLTVKMCSRGIACMASHAWMRCTTILANHSMARRKAHHAGQALAAVTYLLATV